MKHDDQRFSAERFRTLVESYGANPDRWPAEERQAMEKLAAESEDARAWLGEQRRLDTWLKAAPDIAPSPALLRRVAEIPARHHAPRAAWVWPFGRLRNALAVAAAAAAMGMIVGLAMPVVTSDDGGEDWDELSSLALGADISEELP